MMHALTPAGDLDVSVRARRLACVLDPALMLAAPHALLLAQQLARTIDLWVCPAFWRLLDASEFFGRRPQRLHAWLALDDEHPASAVGAALEAWSRWRATRDLAALGLYWVGGHQTESFLPENGPRDVPARFEALMEAWLRSARPAGAVEEVAALVAPEQAPRERPRPALRALHDAPVDDLIATVVAGRGGTAHEPEAAEPVAPAQEGALESAALSVALQVPVLTLAATAQSEPPALARPWAANGLEGRAWNALHPASASAEQQRWWQATIASGAAATVAAASSVGLRLALAQVVAPSAQLLAESGGAEDWADALGAGEAWPGDLFDGHDGAAPGAVATAWWRDAQALWMPL